MGAEGRIKVGIFFNARANQGGLYQYALTLVHCLYKNVPNYDYSLYIATLEEFPFEIQASNWNVVKLTRIAIIYRMALEVILNSLARLGLDITFRIIPSYKKINLDNPGLMLYVKPTPHIFQWHYRALFPVHDLQHRLLPNFPEVSTNGEIKRREYLYKYSLAKAVSVLTDSLVGKEDVIRLYRAEERKIFVLPYIAPTFRVNFPNNKTKPNFNKKYMLPENYLFYPASFWAHKNHARLVQAVQVIAYERGVRIPLVLTGNRNHEYLSLRQLVDKLGLQDTVYFIGFVPDEELPQLYNDALALVMPTFFGPTNIPIIEAWAAGCPVITSDIRGIREQVGDAGILVDPYDVKAISEAIWRINSSTDVRWDLIQKGAIRLREFTPEKFSHSLDHIIRKSINETS